MSDKISTKIPSRPKQRLSSSGRNENQSTKLSKVGIFWVYGGELLAYACDLTVGIHNEWSVNGQQDHVHYWIVFQRRHIPLRKLEYEEVPRGRVLYMKKPANFCVYMDKCLHTTTIKKLILDEYSLPKNRTKFLTDPHYTTNPDDLRRIFAF